MNKESLALEKAIDNLRIAAELNDEASRRMEQVILRMAARMEKKKDVKKKKSTLLKSDVRSFYSNTWN